MATVTNQSKNNATVTRLDKVNDKIWNDAPETYAEAKSPYTWDNPREVIDMEAKNTAVTVANDSKNT